MASRRLRRGVWQRRMAKRAAISATGSALIAQHRHGAASCSSRVMAKWQHQRMAAAIAALASAAIIGSIKAKWRKSGSENNGGVAASSVSGESVMACNKTRRAAAPLASISK